MGPILRAAFLVIAILTVVYLVISGIERAVMRAWYGAAWRRGPRSEPRQVWVDRQMQAFERRVRRQRIAILYLLPIGLLSLLVLFLSID